MSRFTPGKPEVRTDEKASNAKKAFLRLVDLILKGIALAMGIAVAVLSVMNQVDARSALGMLGLGLACLAVSVFPDQEK